MTPKNIWSFLNAYGLDRDLYKEITPAIQENNHRTMRVVLLVCVIVFATLAVLIAFNILAGAPSWVYGLLAVSCIFIFAVENQLYKHIPASSTFTLYLLIALVAVYGFVAGIASDPNQLAVTICLLFCIAPSILIDRPWRISGLIILIAVAFCVAAGQFKTASVASIDYTNVVAATALGLAAGLNSQRARVSSLVEDYAKSLAANLDGLTGVLNKNAFEKQSNTLMNAGINGALLIFDADHFKYINDFYGHAEGDDVIKAIADAISSTIRSSDFAGRFGGDEFCVMLVGNIPPETPEKYFQRANNALRTLVPNVYQEDGTPLTLSCGAAMIEPGCTYEEAFAVADFALYQAKTNRNSIVVKEVDKSLK